MREQEKWYWLYATKGAGKMTAAKLVEKTGDINALFEDIETIEPKGKLETRAVEALRVSKKADNFRREYYELMSRGVKLLVRQAGTLPKSAMSVREVQMLYALGDESCLNAPCVSIVGTREPTMYGGKSAHDLAMTLAQNGVTVVSGMAKGIDTCSHEGALDAGGKTAAVLAGGVYPAYPRRNQNLCAELLEKGGVIISENPPNTPNRPQLFTERNKIISALSQSVAVIEGGEISGARSTAHAALKQGKQLFALPGDVDNRMSELPRMLIEQGALPILGAESILDTLGIKSERANQGGKIISFEKAGEKNERQTMNLEWTKEEKTILTALVEKPLTVDEVSECTRLEISAIMFSLLTMELDGRVVKSGNLYKSCVKL